jgi:hypothetical protein
VWNSWLTDKGAALTEISLQEHSRDTSPLEPEQLSDQELKTIFDIERRLFEVREIDIGKEPQGVEQYLARVQRRHPRVLLLDGGRGTGKTSLLLTLVERWHLGINDDPEQKKQRQKITDGYRIRIEKFQDHLGGSEIPDYIRALDILDFDPLSPGMPLIAGIVQAWRPLAEKFDSLSNYLEDDDESIRLMDLWHGLFRMAAVGWATMPRDKGLIEQVLDREDQVQDWQRFDEQWQSFVTEVIKRGQKLKDVHRLKEASVFVIMIDDVDLQVGRIRELLPVLRLLYHSRVVFLVAADRQHMIHMLRLDFYGQQNELARHRNANATQVFDAAAWGWACDLASSAFEKVFPKRNRIKLEWLSISGFLAYPGQAMPVPVPTALTGEDIDDASLNERSDQTFFSALKSFTNITQSSGANAKNISPPGSLAASRLIQELASQAGKVELPGVMTYRAAEQLRQFVEKFESPHRAPEILARLLSGNGDAQQAVVEVGTSTIDVQITGELAALYRPGPTEFGLTYNVVLSGRPDFVFIGPADTEPRRMSTEPENRFNFTTAMIAPMLQEAGFSVDATGLRWETYLSHAWTEWLLSTPLSFAWTRHKHPRPDELLKQTQDWDLFIQVRSEPKDERKLERYAYAWVYYQRQWSGHSAGQDTMDPLVGKNYTGQLPWPKLLNFDNINDKSEKTKWLTETLPLLARPELGFPLSVQNKLAKGIRGSGLSVKEVLKAQRRRLVTDAFVAAAMQRGRVDQKYPEDPSIEDMIAKIDKIYEGVHSGLSPWKEIEKASVARAAKPSKVRGKG